MNANRRSITGKGKLSSSIVSSALIGSAFMLAAMAMQSSPTGLGGDPIGVAALIVTTTDDVISPDGKISLREAVTTANGQPGMDTITFNIPASESGCTAANACTITLATDLPAINDDVTIDGLPNNGHITVNGNHTVRSGFVVNSQITLNVQNLTLANGNATDCPGWTGGGCGGAIQITGGTVNAANITVMGNSAQLRGGGIIVRPDTSNGIGRLNLTNSTLFGNSSNEGGGIYSWGALQVANSTLSGNSATVIGGGIVNVGTATLKNSIIANSTGGNCVDGTHMLTADSHNLASGCGNARTGSPNLQPLADNGGPTMTMALKLPSDAVDTGDNAVAAAPPVNNKDQRGVTRPQDGDNDGTVTSDIGAYELAVVLVVTTTDDVITPDGKTSLREALTYANGEIGMDIITFNIPASESGCTAANTCTITLGTELPAINGDTTIDGAANNGHITLNGNHSVRVFLVNPGKTCNIQNLTIANGKANDCPLFPGSCGGGIQNNQGTLNVTNVTLKDNQAQDFGGGIYTVNGMLNVTNSTLFNNSSITAGGGIANDGNSTANIINSTFSSNRASAGGGVKNAVGTSTTVLKNTIIASSTGGDCDNAGTLNADSFNLDTDGTCRNATTKTAAEINLQPLTDNGGPTMTMALPFSSAAIDAGDNAVAAAPPVNNKDQRGVTRPRNGNDHDIIAVADIGAYELAAGLIVTGSDDIIANDGKTSLREALTNANTAAGIDTITFNIPASESGCSAANACTIKLATELPAINDDVTIDGLPNNGHITIDGNHTVRSGWIVNFRKRLNVQNLTLANGNAGNGSGGAIVIPGGGEVNATNITVKSNAAQSGGGIAAISPGMGVISTLNVSNSTFFDNSASFGGGLYSDGIVQVNNSTFYGNNATAGGGVYGGTLQNSIVANSTGGDCYSFVTADSFNLDTDGTCGNATTNTAAEINLQSLANNGGPTMTMALQLPSAAVDTGDDAVAAAPPVNNMDQRGVTRPKDGNNDSIVVSDVGAFELLPTQCSVCHKHNSTLILPCNGLEYRRHLDHGDPPNACISNGPAGRSDHPGAKSL